ncbi:MAG: MobF family relaxase [Acidiferrobacter thiooxydans]
MTVKAIKSADHAKSYFGKEAQLEKEIGAYYTSDNAFGGGRWMGRGAEELGLRGAVGVHQFEKALEGHLPGGITIAPRSDGTHRPGNDCVFQAPKSFSLMALAAGDERLIAVHDRAVEKALRWVEEHHQFARLGKGGQTRELTGKSVVAAFRHATARPVGGEVECHLHTHGVHINATQRADGKWVASNLGMDADWEKAAGAVYRMEAALGAKQCGYEIEVGKDAMFDLAGITREQIERFSPRSQQIEAELAKIGKTRATATAAEKNAANLRTRESKQSAKLDGPELQKRWRELAEREGFTRIRDEAMARAAAGPIPTDPKTITVTASAAVQSAIRHLSERESAFTQSAIIGAAAEFGLGKVATRDIERALDKEVAAGRLLPATNDRFTTQQAISREQSFIARINRGKDSVTPIMREAPASMTTAGGKPLTPDQHAATVHILESRDRFVALQGAAGALKTTTMATVREQAETAGFVVVGLAPTHKAVTELRGAGIQDVRTVASALGQFQSGKPVPSNVLYVLDEAGMVSARDMAGLTAEIERAGGRMVSVGDTRQLQAVEAGSPFRQMQQHVDAAELTEIRRQTNAQLKECVQAFAVGDEARGADLAQGFMYEVPEDKIASQAAAAYTSLTPEDRAGTLVITGTNAMRAEINEQIRDHMKEARELGPQEITAAQLQKIDLTREQAKHTHNYTAGQTVQFQRDYERGVSEPVERGRQYEVTFVDRDHNRVTLTDRESGQQIEWSPNQAAKVTLSTQSEIGLSDGDRVVFKSTDHERGITNGDRGTVIQSGAELYVAFDKGGVLTLDPTKPEHLEYAYATTVHSAQGATCDRVIVAAPYESLTATAEQGYVSLSRARQDALVFTDDKAALGEKWGMERTKENALEVVAEKSQAQEKGQDHDGPTPARDQAPTREFSR